MNTQDAIVLMRKLEAAWPNIFAKSKDREQLYLDELISSDYSKAATAVSKLIGTQKMPPAIADIRHEVEKLKILDAPAPQPESTNYGPNKTSEGHPIATYEQAKLAFARGYRKAKPQATDEQIQQIFGKMNIQKQESEIF